MTKRFVNGINSLKRLCKGKIMGRLSISEENVKCIRESFLGSLKKFVRNAGHKLPTPVWNV